MCNKHHFFVHADNKIWNIRMVAGFFNQIFSNSFIAVETFLFLSGFLTTYLFLKREKSQKKITPINYRAKLNKFFFLIIKRFVRYVLYYLDSHR